MTTALRMINETVSKATILNEEFRELASTEAKGSVQEFITVNLGNRTDRDIDQGMNPEILSVLEAVCTFVYDSVEHAPLNLYSKIR